MCRFSFEKICDTKDGNCTTTVFLCLVSLIACFSLGVSHKGATTM